MSIYLLHDKRYLYILDDMLNKVHLECVERDFTNLQFMCQLENGLSTNCNIDLIAPGWIDICPKYAVILVLTFKKIG